MAADNGSLAKTTASYIIHISVGSVCGQVHRAGGCAGGQTGGRLDWRGRGWAFVCDGAQIPAVPQAGVLEQPRLLRCEERSAPTPSTRIQAPGLESQREPLSSETQTRHGYMARHRLSTRKVLPRPHGGGVGRHVPTSLVVSTTFQNAFSQPEAAIKPQSQAPKPDPKIACRWGLHARVFVSQGRIPRRDSWTTRSFLLRKSSWKVGCVDGLAINAGGYYRRDVPVFGSVRFCQARCVLYWLPDWRRSQKTNLLYPVLV